MIFSVTCSVSWSRSLQVLLLRQGLPARALKFGSVLFLLELSKDATRPKTGISGSSSSTEAKEMEKQDLEDFISLRFSLRTWLVKGLCIHRHHQHLVK